MRGEFGLILRITMLVYRILARTVANLDVRFTLGKSCSDGLFNPEHMSQVRPAVRVRSWLCLTVLPANRLYERGSAPICGIGCQKFAIPRSPAKSPLGTSNPVRRSSWHWVAISDCSDACHTVIGGCSPKYKVIFAAILSRRKIPKEKLAGISILFVYGIYAHGHTLRVSSAWELIGRRPAQLSPTSKSTNGIFVPFT